MIDFDKNRVLLLYKYLMETTGGTIGIRDENLLESALTSPFASFAGVDFYPDKEMKAARLGFSLISNHAFIDGNKRIGIYIMLSFLTVNGIRLNYTDEEIIKLGLSVADGKMKYEDLLNWIYAHEIK